jgi:hypothetical protein
MSREIRFNAWDNINKVMIYDVAVYQNGDHIGIGIDEAVRILDILNKREPQSEDDFFPYSIGDDDLPSNWASGESDWYFILSGFVLLQYTGLKDKNGKEIYEGDICRIDWQDERFKKQIGVVKWDSVKGGFDFGPGSASEVVWSHEVIGNIYEHPELLNSSTSDQRNATQRS